jgi:hypothetical protein
MAKLGHKAWNKGIKGSVKPNRTSFKKGDVRLVGNKINLGRRAWNKETKGLIKANPGSFDIDMTGDKNKAWKGGHDKYWKRQALARDNGICQMCGLDEAEIMVVDHIRPKAIRPDLRRSLDNLMTLCPNCHARKTKIDFKAITLFKKENSHG